MENKSLKLNLLTFEFPKENLKLYFSKTPAEYSRKVHHTLFPRNIEDHFPGITTQPDGFLFTSFSYPEEGFVPVDIEIVPGNYPLLKLSYHKWLKYYFRKIKKLLIKSSFIDDPQVWIHLPDVSTEIYDIYEKYSLKIQFCQVSEYPELIISYDGESKILKKSVTEIIEQFGSEELNWIYHNNSLQRYASMVEYGFSQFNEARPVLNLQLAKAAGFEIVIPRASNPYPKHLGKIQEFIRKYLWLEEFKKTIPLHSNKLFQVPPALCTRTSPGSNQLVFNNRQTSQNPYAGLKDFGPFQPPQWAKIQLLYIVHNDDTEIANSLHMVLLKGLKNYPGLSTFVKVNAYTNKESGIKFSNRSHPLPEVAEALTKREFKPDVRYIAIYITPYGKYEPSPAHNRIYFQMKELLLSHNITMQAIEAEKIKTIQSAFQYSLTNIALAMLAKLGGIPWRLGVQRKKELIIGVGAFRHSDTRTQYLGSAFSFDNNGSFNRFEHFLKHETRLLAGSIANAVRQFGTVNKDIDRLIIHFYKTMSQKELQPIEDALHNLGLSIPVFIVSINKTESHDLTGFDTDYEGLMPLSGSSVNIGRNRYLLFNNSRYNNSLVKITDGYPFPVKMAINCTHQELLDDSRVIGELIEQVYQFSRLYYKSVRQQGLPVTIKYPEILASMVPRFKHESIPQFGLDNLWFL